MTSGQKLGSIPLAVIPLLMLILLNVVGGWLTPHPYDRQFREDPLAAPSRKFLLGTDELGRDRLARLVEGSRVSLLLAASAAMLSVFLGIVVATGSVIAGTWGEKLLMGMADLWLCLPWLFALLILRSALPLDLPPSTSVLVTFGLLGCLSWAGPARVLQTRVAGLKEAPWVVQVRALGVSPYRLVLRHVLPSLVPVLIAQFLFVMPTLVLAEANLGLLGLGVAEPLPSLGTLLREWENFGRVRANPSLLAPGVVLISTVLALRILLPGNKANET